MIANVRFGADPELFLVDIETNELVSAVGKIGGTKTRPFALDDKGHCLQEDNVAIEFNIPPVKTPKEFQQEIEFMMQEIHNRIKSKYRMCIDAARLFPEAELNTPQAQTFGCDPDFCAWTMTENKKPVTPEGMKNLRSCGGHLHISWDNPEIEDQINLVRALDVHAALPMSLVEGSTIRTRLYGNPGAFRFKPYGIEYRTLSNFWLRKPDYAAYVVELAQQAIDFINTGDMIDEEDYSRIKEALIDHKYVQATYLIRKYGVKNVFHY